MLPTLDAVSAPRTERRHRALRWLVPLGVLGLLGATAGSLLRSGSTTEGLPGTSGRELAAQVRDAVLRPGPGYSGTVIARLSLGLPGVAVDDPPSPAAATGRVRTLDAPAAAVEQVLVGSDPATQGLTDVLTGTHTMRYWFGGPQLQRVALLSPTDEADVFYSGHDVWLWDSTGRVATHATMGTAAEAPLSVATLTPQQLTARALAAVDAGTDLSVGDRGRVAGRPTHDLVLTPGDARSRIGSVHIAVDAATRVPLAVRVYARGQDAATDAPAVDVAFAAVTFRSPAPSLFHFTPPADATVIDAGPPGLLGAVAVGAVRAATMGEGWSTVVEVACRASSLGPARAVLRGLEPVRGRWGSGRVIESELLSALVTDDGRVLVGAVDPPELYRAAGR